MTGRIHLKNMAFYGYHGYHPGESSQGQRFFVDLVLTLDIGEAAAEDRLSATVNYSQVHAICRRIVEGEKVKLLETLCRRIMDAIFLECDRVARVEVTVRKPGAPIPGLLDYVAVEACSDRPDRVPRSG